MKLLILLGIIAVTVGVSAAQSCTAYEGSACSSVFSSANLTATSQSQIDALDTTIDTYFTALSLASILLPISQDCLNYLRFTRCLSVFTPCSGTAWCGSMNGTELTEALNSACGCSGSSCTVGGMPVATFRNYYQGSSSTGQVNNGTLYCQDVTVATGSAMGTMKMSAMGAALVTIFLSIGLLL